MALNVDNSTLQKKSLWMCRQCSSMSKRSKALVEKSGRTAARIQTSLDWFSVNVTKAREKRVTLSIVSSSSVGDRTWLMFGFVVVMLLFVQTLPGAHPVCETCTSVEEMTMNHSYWNVLYFLFIWLDFVLFLKMACTSLLLAEFVLGPIVAKPLTD